MNLRSIGLALVLAASVAGTTVEASAPPLVEGREANPVAREFYQTELPLVEEEGPAPAAQGKLDPELCLTVLTWLTVPLGMW